MRLKFFNRFSLIKDFFLHLSHRHLFTSMAEKEKEKKEQIKIFSNESNN